MSVNAHLVGVVRICGFKSYHLLLAVYRKEISLHYNRQDSRTKISNKSIIKI